MHMLQSKDLRVRADAEAVISRINQVEYLDDGRRVLDTPAGREFTRVSSAVGDRMTKAGHSRQSSQLLHVSRDGQVSTHELATLIRCLDVAFRSPAGRL